MPPVPFHYPTSMKHCLETKSAETRRILLCISLGGSYGPAGFAGKLETKFVDRILVSVQVAPFVTLIQVLSQLGICKNCKKRKNRVYKTVGRCVKTVKTIDS